MCIRDRCQCLCQCRIFVPICNRLYVKPACIFRCFLSRDVDWLVKAFVTYVRPIVEYASPVWNPTAKTLIAKIEAVQRRYIKRLPGYSCLTYGQRLERLNLQSLENRRLMADLPYSKNTMVLPLYIIVYHGTTMVYHSIPWCTMVYEKNTMVLPWY